MDPGERKSCVYRAGKPSELISSYGQATVHMEGGCVCEEHLHGELAEPEGIVDIEVKVGFEFGSLATIFCGDLQSWHRVGGLGRDFVVPDVINPAAPNMLLTNPSLI
ncbi:hypothetical protein CBL_10360 [Carabus blaptoides fortunei]